MLLLGHNAYLVEIQSPAVPADPAKGIAGSTAVTRWSGYAQAYVDEDLIREVRQGQVVIYSTTIVDLPSNMPVWPNEDDLITIQRTGVMAPSSAASQESPPSDVMKVRGIDGGLLPFGKVRVHAVRS